MQHTDHLVDLLAEATINSPSENYVDLEKMILAREVETAIFQHPTSTISFPPVVIGSNAFLLFGCGIKQAAWSYIKNPLRFSVSVETEAGRRKIFTAKLDPRRKPTDRAWQRHKIDLSRWEGQSLRIILQTSVGWRRSTEYAWAGWANPRIVHDVPQLRSSPRRDPRDRHPHVFLITADALPARYLGCYGHPTIQTPALDQLAREGILSEQAWSQSCMTLSSYVSMLTGLHPREHGVRREWESFPLNRASLPAALAANGYHTLFAASSREMSARNNDLDRLFRDVIPTLSNPIQDGAITTRQFIQRFEQRPDQPFFCWLQYFDAHPPSMPPAPFDTLYYAADPTDRQREYLPSQIGRIRSVESALIIRTALPWLERGEPVAELIDVLADTAAVLKGQSKQAPDLAEHVLNLGPRAMLGQSQTEFGEWLSDQAEAMASGRVPDTLIEWLQTIVKLFDHTERDITSWLEDVVDFRYPLCIYESTVTYLDAQIGSLMAYLRDRDLYDQSLIIVTAPHGEILQHEVLPYQHLVLAPDTLHVPLIIKPPVNAGLESTGIRVDGVFDLIDLFPTTLEILGIERSPNVSGVSRWNRIKSGQPLPAHDSFAAGLHQMAQSVFRPPYLFAQERIDSGALTFQTLVGGAREVLYEVDSGRIYAADFPEIANELRRSLASHGS